jgi:HlyD family secretion protein
MTLKSAWIATRDWTSATVSKVIPAKYHWIVWIAVAILLVGGIAWWLYARAKALPDYLAEANGRLEMTRIDIAVKYPGRVVDLSFHEGDTVRRGTILAQQDTSEIRTQIAAAEAMRQRAISGIARAEAELEVRKNAQRLAHLEWSHTVTMRGKELVSDVELERRRIALAAEDAAVEATASAVNEARTTLPEADAQIARLKVILGEATIRAPADGRIEYRIVETDAVLPSGGRVASLLEPDDVYITVFFASAVAGKLKIGDEARIVLDAFDGAELPAKVSFVSPEAQFTPKYVETASERENLVYRVKLQIPVAVARQYSGSLKAGMTGNGYVRTDTTRPWPTHLKDYSAGDSQ